MKSSSCLVRIFRCAALCAIATSAPARPGDLDFRFNAAGTNSPPGSARLTIPNQNTSLQNLTILPDGKILTMGMVDFRLVLCRWLPDGSPDPAFGTGGVAIIPQGFAMSMVDMAVQTDGGIVVAGRPIGAVRFLADGTLDSSFGTGGKVVINRPPDAYGVISAVVMLNDGKILLGGHVQDPPSGIDVKPALWRMLPDGRVDQSFGVAGGIALPIENASIFDMAVQPDGKVVVAGATPFPGIPSHAWLARCDADGALDFSFGSAGSAIVPAFPGAPATQTSKVTIQSNGKLVITGPVFGGEGGFFLARYHQNGSPDATFGGDGYVVTNVSPGADYPLALAVQRDGKPVVTGSASDKLVLVRYLPDGAIDDGFGTGGIVTPWTQIGSSSGSAVALQPDGRIVVGGTAFDAGESKDRLLLMRLDGELPETLAGEWPAGTVLAKGGAIQFGPVLRGDPTMPETTITLRNTGNNPLTNLTATLTGPGANRFALLSTLPAVLDSGTSAAVKLRFLPAPEISSFTAGLVIESRDPDMPVFAAQLRGSTVLPAAALALLDGSQTVGENAAVNFGSTVASRPVTRVFTIRNTGNIELQVQGLSLATAGMPGDFAVGPPETDILPAGASTTFPVTFTPSGAGERTARLRIASTDTLGLPLEVTLTGKLAEGLAAWRLTHFGSLLNEGPGADLRDPDNDGAVNLMEYATATDPAAFSSSPGDWLVTENTIEYTFTRPLDAGNFLRYSLESAASLPGPWADTGTRLQELSDDGSRQHVKFALPAGPAGDRRFVRLRVTVK